MKMSMSADHNDARYNEYPLQEPIDTATTGDPDPATAKLLNEGVQTFVAVLAMLKGYEVDTGNLSH